MTKFVPEAYLQFKGETFRLIKDNQGNLILRRCESLLGHRDNALSCFDGTFNPALN